MTTAPSTRRHLDDCKTSRGTQRQLADNGRTAGRLLFLLPRPRPRYQVSFVPFARMTYPLRTHESCPQMNRYPFPRHARTIGATVKRANASLRRHRVMPPSFFFCPGVP